MLFSFLLTIKIMQGDNRVDGQEWKFLISGMGTPGKGITEENPDPDWIDANTWTGICTLATLPFFSGLEKDFGEDLQKWKRVFDSTEPQKMKFPGAKYAPTPSSTPHRDTANSFFLLFLRAQVRGDEPAEKALRVEVPQEGQDHGRNVRLRRARDGAEVRGAARV
jgi:hypothetical protein